MRRHDEQGFTLVEVMVAMVIAVVGVVAVLTSLEKGTAVSVAQQRDTQAATIGEQEVERARDLVKTYGFASLMLSSTPVATAIPAGQTNPVDPNAWVSGSTFRVRTNWHDTGSTDIGGTGEALLVSPSTVVGGADRLDPGPSTVTVGKQTATVWRYVTRRPEGACPTGTTSCQNDSRRITIAVRVQNGPTGIQDGSSDLKRATPVYFSTIVNAGVPSNQAAGSGGLELGVNLP